MKKVSNTCVRSSSFSGGIVSHAAPETPGFIHEGVENLVMPFSRCRCVLIIQMWLLPQLSVRDGEGEQVHWWLVGCQHLLEPSQRWAILPIFFYLNGGKIHTPTIFERKTDEELALFLWRSCWKPICECHRDFRRSMKLPTLCSLENWWSTEEIKKVQAEARKVLAEEELNQYILSDCSYS